MKYPAFDALVQRVVKASGARGRVKRELQQEIESHLWEAVRELEEKGIAEQEISSRIIHRFGSPEIIGQQLSLMHGIVYKTVQVFIPLFLSALAIIAILPGDVEKFAWRYDAHIQKEYLDHGWYTRTVALEAEKSSCTFVVDGLGSFPVPFGYVLTSCYTKWLVLKFLPPIQISGPRITPSQVLHVMKMEGGLRSVDVVFGDDPVEGLAHSVLQAYLQALAIGAGNAPTVDMLNGNTDEPEEFGETIDRRWSFYEAATYLLVDDGEFTLHYSDFTGDGFVPLEYSGLSKDHGIVRKAAFLSEACARDLLCYPLKEAELESIEQSDEDEHVIMEFSVQLKSEDPEISERRFLFEVTRFPAGYPHDWNDDLYRVTRGLVYRP